MVRDSQSTRSGGARPSGTSFRERWSSARLGVTAGITVFLLLAGTGVSYAWWQATTNASSTSSGATVSASQALSGTPGLAHTYSAAAPVAAGVITVTNTSSRNATYTTTLNATSLSGTLRPAVAVAVGTATTCTTTATLGSPVTGSFGGAVTYTGSLAAGASVALCVRTSMTAAAITANSSATLTAAATTSVLVGTWTATAPQTVTFAQSVAQSTALDPDAWYWIHPTLNSALCVEVNNSATTSGSAISQQGCSTNGSAANELWRFVPTTNGFYRIVPRHATNLGWGVNSSNTAQRLRATTSTSNLAQWQILSNSDGSISMSLRDTPARCAVVRNASTNAGERIELGACSTTSNAKKFNLELFTEIPEFSIDTNAWYWINSTTNSALCLEVQNFSTTTGVDIVQQSCDLSGNSANELWRFVPTTNGFYTLVPKHSSAIWWGSSNSNTGNRVTTSNSTSTLAQWRILDNDDGTVSFSLRDNTDRCAVVDGGSAVAGENIELGSCTTSTLPRKFTLRMFEIATPAPIALSCTGDGYTRLFSWPVLTGYQSVVTYRVLVDGEVDTIHTRATAYDTNAQFGGVAARAEYGAGTYSIEVQQSISGGSWSKVGDASLVINNSDPILQCGS
ncbi:MAG: RICIN domain-containing protein [Microbacteriaceae bacterium]